MSHPIHSVNYVRKKYKTYQLISIIFAVITIAAALSAAVTGFRITRMNNRQKEALSLQRPEVTDLNELKAEIKALKKESIGYQKQLASEKKRVKSLSAKIETLENELTKTSELPKTETAPAAESNTEAAADAAGLGAAAPIAAEDTVSTIIPTPSAPQEKEALESPPTIDSQTPHKDKAPASGSIPSAPPVTTVKPPPATESDSGTEDKTPPPAPAAQPEVAPDTGP